MKAARTGFLAATGLEARGRAYAESAAVIHLTPAPTGSRAVQIYAVLREREQIRSTSQRQLNPHAVLAGLLHPRTPHVTGELN
jgi:hypothetical protein